MAKLKYSLFELNGNILFTIYEQDERFRVKMGDICFVASNEVEVHSCNCPQISVRANKTIIVYMRGCVKIDDNSIVILNKLNFEHAGITPQGLIEKIDFALKEWAEEWEGWEEELPCKDEIVGVKIKEV